MTSPYNEPPETALRALFDRAACLLMDFDGPMCRLFAPEHAPAIARSMLELLDERGAPLPGLDPDERSDPHVIVRALLPRQMTQELESRLAEEEEVAAATATPTAGAAEFVALAVEQGRILAVTTNNAPRAVQTYLKDQGLEYAFEGRIFGRSTENPRLMKPDPDCLLRAIDALGAAAPECLMIGDSPADAEAARRAGVPFIGYAATPRRVARLAGAPTAGPVVVGMHPLIRALRHAAPPKE